jgi:hypothetical protein
MSISKKHIVEFGDVLCNTKTGRFYVIAGYTLSSGGRKRVFMVCLEADAAKNILQEPPISFDKDTVSELVYVDNVSEALKDRIEEKGYAFDTWNIRFVNFRCRPK